MWQHTLSSWEKDLESAGFNVTSGCFYEAAVLDSARLGKLEKSAPQTSEPCAVQKAFLRAKGAFESTLLARFAQGGLAAFVARQAARQKEPAYQNHLYTVSDVMPEIVFCVLPSSEGVELHFGKGLEATLNILCADGPHSEAQPRIGFYRGRSGKILAALDELGGAVSCQGPHEPLESLRVRRNSFVFHKG